MALNGSSFMFILPGTNLDNVTLASNLSDMASRKFIVVLREWHVVMIAVLSLLVAVTMIGIVLATQYYKILRRNRRQNEMANNQNEEIAAGIKSTFKSFCQRTNSNSRTISPSSENPSTTTTNTAIPQALSSNNTDTHETPLTLLPNRLPPIATGNLVSQHNVDKDTDATLSSVHTHLPDNQNHPINNNILRMPPLLQGSYK